LVPFASPRTASGAACLIARRSFRFVRVKSLPIRRPMRSAGLCGASPFGPDATSGPGSSGSVLCRVPPDARSRRVVSLYTVSQELGHESEDMVRRVYARLGKVRHRAESPRVRCQEWFDEVQGVLVPKAGPGKAYHRPPGALELGSGKQYPALFSRTVGGRRDVSR